jgi:hypothetical protein
MLLARIQQPASMLLSEVAAFPASPRGSIMCGITCIRPTAPFGLLAQGRALLSTRSTAVTSSGSSSYFPLYRSTAAEIRESSLGARFGFTPTSRRSRVAASNDRSPPAARGREIGPASGLSALPDAPDASLDSELIPPSMNQNPSASSSTTCSRCRRENGARLRPDDAG